jgi:SMODS-associating 2TM, beta-strand rich effector domain
MIPDRLFRLLVAVIVLAFLAGCLLHQSIYSAFTTAATVGGLFLLVWDRYIWHWWLFYPYFDTKPHLAGTWRGRLDSDFVNAAGEKRTNIESYLVIRQTYSKINVRYFSEESGSVSLSANLVVDGDGIYQLACTYQNTPRALVRDSSPMAYGGLLLNVRGGPAKRMDGEYWTSRKTKGEMFFAEWSKDLAEDFKQAQSLEYRGLE